MLPPPFWAASWAAAICAVALAAPASWLIERAALCGWHESVEPGHELRAIIAGPAQVCPEARCPARLVFLFLVVATAFAAAALCCAPQQAILWAVLAALLAFIALADHLHGYMPEVGTWGGLLLGLLAAAERLLPISGTEAIASAAAVWFGIALFRAAGTLALGAEVLGAADGKALAMAAAWLGGTAVVIAIPFACAAAYAASVGRDDRARLGPFIAAGLLPGTLIAHLLPP